MYVIRDIAMFIEIPSNKQYLCMRLIKSFDYYLYKSSYSTLSLSESLHVSVSNYSYVVNPVLESPRQVTPQYRFIRTVFWFKRSWKDDKSSDHISRFNWS